ncbi:hypothetical protein SKAU_G00066470 [Synaphobranchus kaupii]|uniref:Phospholipid scramblase n=1 Tax=Synaphobranchus kaupii TaxID=118154 RepID=A0A9Q1JBA7_SYNKA|nr:hypothetical protein SKAU_G00066470 [Synaphobranchus kaupii]
MGQNVFYAVEENDCLSRQCCGPMRSFTIRVLDNFGHEVITISRPLKCCVQELARAECRSARHLQGAKEAAGSQKDGT